MCHQIQQKTKVQNPAPVVILDDSEYLSCPYNQSVVTDVSVGCSLVDLSLSHTLSSLSHTLSDIYIHILLDCYYQHLNNI
jgi:hypothetical protein